MISVKLWCLFFTFKQHSWRFSARTHSQQQQQSRDWAVLLAHTVWTFKSDNTESEIKSKTFHVPHVYVQLQSDVPVKVEKRPGLQPWMHKPGDAHRPRNISPWFTAANPKTSGASSTDRLDDFVLCSSSKCRPCIVCSSAPHFFLSFASSIQSSQETTRSKKGTCCEEVEPQTKVVMIWSINLPSSPSPLAAPTCTQTWAGLLLISTLYHISTAILLQCLHCRHDYLIHQQKPDW